MIILWHFRKLDLHILPFFFFFTIFYCCSSTVVSISPPCLPPPLPTLDPTAPLVLSMCPLYVFLKTSLHYPLLLCIKQSGVRLITLAVWKIILSFLVAWKLIVGVVGTGGGGGRMERRENSCLGDLDLRYLLTGVCCWSWFAHQSSLF